MKERPLRTLLNTVLGSGSFLAHVLRWPLNHLVLSYSDIFGDRTWPLQAFLSAVLVLTLSNTLLYSTRLHKLSPANTLRLAHLGYVLTSYLNILTSLPQGKEQDTLSTLRSYTVIGLTNLQAIWLIGDLASDIGGISPLIHFDFIIQSLSLSGMWRLIDDTAQSDSAPFYVFFLVYGWVAWAIAGMMLTPDNKGSAPLPTAEEGGESGLEHKKAGAEPSNVVKRHVRLITLDTILLIFLQYG